MIIIHNFRRLKKKWLNICSSLHWLRPSFDSTLYWNPFFDWALNWSNRWLNMSWRDYFSPMFRCFVESDGILHINRIRWMTSIRLRPRFASRRPTESNTFSKELNEVMRRWKCNGVVEGQGSRISLQKVRQFRPF